MPTGLRAADAPAIQRHCGSDMALLLRIGSLLQSRLAFSEPALAALLDTGAKALILDRRLRSADGDAFAALCAEHRAGELGLVLTAADGEPDWRVVALDDELGNPLLATPVPPQPGLASLVPTLAPALRAPVEGLLAARADDQRAAALEQLRYATPPLPVVGELMPLLLADGAELVRERAIGLLAGAGAQVAVIDLVRALQRRDDEAVRRLAPVVARLDGEQQDVAVAALVAALARSQATQAIADLAAALAERLARHPALGRVLDLLLPTGRSLIDLVRTAQRIDRTRVDTLLTAAFGQGREQDARLVLLLAAPGLPAADGAALIERGLDLLLAPEAEPIDRLPLAGALLRLDAVALAPRLAARADSLGRARDTAVHWLLAELCRSDALTETDAACLAASVGGILRQAPGQHLLAVLEQQVPSLLPAPAPARAALAEPMVEAVARYRDDRTRDTVVANLLRLGDLAIDPLWRLLDDHPLARVRLLAAEMLPELLQSSDSAHADALATAVGRLLAGLNRCEQAEERAARVTAAAALAACDGLATDPAPSRLVEAATAGLGDWSLDAIGHLAAGPHLDGDQRAALIDRLLQTVQEEVPDADTAGETRPGDDAPTWLIDDALSRHTDNVPRALAALARAGTSPHLSPSLLARIVQRLCRQWKLVANWRVVWGPGCVQELARTLVRLAERAEFPGELRVPVCEALAGNAGQLSVARGLARVLLHAEGPFLAALAGRAAARVVELASTDHYAEDEQEELVEALTDLLAIPRLGPDGDALRRRLVQLIALRREHASSRARARLRYLATELPAELRERLHF